MTTSSSTSETSDASTTGEPTGTSSTSTTGTTGITETGTSSSTTQEHEPDPASGDLIVFVTGRSRLYPAEQLGGGDSQLAGADAICNDLAQQAGLPGRYKAWLSTAETWPALRFVPPSPGESYIRPDGSAVVWVGQQLLEGTVGAPIDLDPFGVSIFDQEAGPLGVWTGTSIDGTPSPAGHCDGWTSAAGFAAKGLAGSNGPTWTTSFFGASCRDQLPIYCFQQRPGCAAAACTGTAAASVTLGLVNPWAGACAQNPCDACDQAVQACASVGAACPATKELCGEAVDACGCG